MDFQPSTLLTHGRSVGTYDWCNPSMLLEHGRRSLTHEVLTTFLTEASSIINSRPLIPVSTDPENPFVLTPSTLLTPKSDTTPDIAPDVDQDNLLRKQWKRVQHLSSIFWKRWKVEYLNALQRRHKWTSPQRNVSTGDVVLIRDKQLYRNSWPIGTSDPNHTK